MSEFIKRFGGNTETMAHSGMIGLRNAMAAGMTLNEIRDMTRREGVEFGVEARNYLNERANQSDFISTYGGNEDTMGHSGIKAVNKALGMGLSWDQIRDQAAQDNVSWGWRAQDFFDQMEAKHRQNNQTNTNSNSNNVSYFSPDENTTDSTDSFERPDNSTNVNVDISQEQNMDSSITTNIGAGSVFGDGARVGNNYSINNQYQNADVDLELYKSVHNAADAKERANDWLKVNSVADGYSSRSR